MTTIKEFLLSRAMQDEAESDAQGTSWPSVADRNTHQRAVVAGRHRGHARHRASLHTELRAEIEKHNDRSITITSPGGAETMTRCGTCPQEATQPCRGLRLLALPYADHPTYQSVWRFN